MAGSLIASLAPTTPVAGRPSQEVINELTSGLVRISRRVEIYESDGETPFDIPNWDARLVGGSVTVDRERDERRSIDLLLENSDGALKNDPYDGFWYDKIIKAFWGVRYYSQTLQSWTKWDVPLGVFMIDRLDEDRFPDAVKVTGRDLTKRCLVSKLSHNTLFQSGMKVEDIIRAVGSNAGITKFALPATTEAYNLDLTFARGTNRWEIIKKVADSIGYEPYFLPDGSLTMRRYPDPTLDPIAWSFTRNQGGTLVDYKRSSNDSRVFNHIIVIGATVGGETFDQPPAIESDLPEGSASEIVFAEAINTDPSSPTNVDRIGDRVEVYESDIFTSVEQAQQYADTQLRIASLEEYSMDFQSLIIPWLDGSDIVEIVEEDVSDFSPRRFLLSNLTIPLGLGSMTGTGRRVTIVGTRQTQEIS